MHAVVLSPSFLFILLSVVLFTQWRRYASPGRSYALPVKKEDLALGPACDIVMKCKA